jgi:biotin transporter BioY
VPLDFTLLATPSAVEAAVIVAAMKPLSISSRVFEIVKQLIGVISIGVEHCASDGCTSARSFCIIGFTGPNCF